MVATRRGDGAVWFPARRRTFMGSALVSQSWSLRLMPDLLYPFILWPVGIALGSLLFFEIARRM
jgi:hypothetical protein